MSLPQPIGMTMREWTDAAVLALDNFDNIGTVFQDDWQEWGARVLNVVSLGGFTLPDPYGFADWREWAQRLCEELT